MPIKYEERVSDLQSITAQEMRELHHAYELADFMDRLLSEMRGIEFGQRDTCSVWVHYKNDVLPLGFIGYADYRDTGEGDRKFVVYSRAIENNQYNQYNIQHHMKMSSNIETALKSAKKFLRVWSSMELCRFYWDIAQRAWTQAKHEAEKPLDELKRKVFDGSYITLNKKYHNELFHLVQSGHKFMDDEFHRNIYELHKVMNELSDLHAAHQHTFAFVYEKFGTTYIDTMVLDQSGYGSVELLNIVTYKDDELPQELMEKIAVMQILPQGDYALRVGVNMGDGMYYVY